LFFLALLPLSFSSLFFFLRSVPSELAEDDEEGGLSGGLSEAEILDKIVMAFFFERLRRLHSPEEEFEIIIISYVEENELNLVGENSMNQFGNADSIELKEGSRQL
jgi:hypothetical protein